MAKSEKPFNFQFDYGEFSVTTAHTPLANEPYVELVHKKIGPEGRVFKYTIAYWHKGSDGWSLIFVGDRMIELSQLEIGHIWPQLCAGQIALDAWFKDQEDEY